MLGRRGVSLVLDRSALVHHQRLFQELDGREVRQRFQLCLRPGCEWRCSVVFSDSPEHRVNVLKLERLEALHVRVPKNLGGQQPKDGLQ